MHDRHSLFDVVIAGAGPVGLFLACELRLGGASVLVLERAESPHSPLKTLPFGLRGLTVPTIEAFDRRGLLEEIAPALQGARRHAGHFAGIPFDEEKIDRSKWTYRLPSPADCNRGGRDGADRDHPRRAGAGERRRDPAGDRRRGFCAIGRQGHDPSQRPRRRPNVRGALAGRLRPPVSRSDRAHASCVSMRAPAGSPSQPTVSGALRFLRSLRGEPGSMRTRSNISKRRPGIGTAATRRSPTCAWSSRACLKFERPVMRRACERPNICSITA